MKNLLRFVPVAFFFVAISVVYGAVPALSVTVSDASGKAAFRGATNSSGTFATANLKPGNYVVQFHSASPAVKGNQYALVISAGKKKVSAEAIAGDKLNAGGVAMKIDVAAGLKITGQVAASANVKIDEKTKKKLVYIPQRIGSNIPGRWVPADSPEAIAAQNSGEIRREDVRKWQDHGDTGVSKTGN
jgi:hypothetical protein